MVPAAVSIFQNTHSKMGFLSLWTNTRGTAAHAYSVVSLTTNGAAKVPTASYPAQNSATSVAFTSGLSPRNSAD